MLRTFSHRLPLAISPVLPSSTIRSMSSYSRLIRFTTSSSPTTPSIGEPVSFSQDIGLAAYSSEPIEVELFSGKSILNPGEKTGEVVEVDKLLSPLGEDEVGTIRCIGLNVSLSLRIFGFG